MYHDESQRLQRMCRELKGKSSLTRVLKRAQDLTTDVLNKANEEEDEFGEALDPPSIIGT